MKKFKEIITVLVMLGGLLIAALTDNLGNVFIFLGLFLGYLGTNLDIKKTPIYKWFGVLVFAVGLGWSILQPTIPALSWGSVFLTLIITSIGD